MTAPRPRTPPFRPLALPLLAAALALPCTPVAAAPADDRAQMEAQYHVMAGEMAAGRKQPALAAREFLLALDTVKDAELAARATSLALAAREADLAMDAAQRWLALEPNSMDAREVIARLSLRKGDLGQTLAQCQDIIRGHAGGEAEGFQLVARLLGQADPSQGDGALAVMKQLVGQWPQLGAAHHALGVLALRFGQPGLADQAAREALRLEPASKEHALLLVGVLVKQEKLDEADTELEKLLKGESKPGDLRMGYAKLLLESDQRERARAQLLRVLKDQPDSADARFALGVLAYNDRRYVEAADYLQPLTQGPRAVDAYYQLGRVEEARRHYSQALAHYQKVDSGNAAIDAAVRRAYVLAQLDRVDEAQQLMAQLREQLPQFQLRFFLAEGDLLLSSGHGEQALALYAAALQQHPDDAELLYGRSLVYERAGKLDLAEKDLRAILARDADDARAMNALGYMLTTHTGRLDEASKLVARALELAPDDAAVMDSMGWVQFKLGKRQEARGLLQKAFDRFPDPEVAAHLGEVLWTLGEHDQARAVWDRALQADPAHEVLKETVERLTK